MTTIEILKKKVVVCKVISYTAAVLILISFIAEFCIGELMADKEAVIEIVNKISNVATILPAVALIPWFFIVNLKNKITIEERKMNKKA